MEMTCLQPTAINQAFGYGYGDSSQHRCLLLAPSPFLQLQRNPQHRHLIITSSFQHRKDYALDSVIQRQKKLKLVSTIKDLLVKQPGMVMSLKELGRYRKKLGVTDKRKIVSLLKKYPGVFEVFEEGMFDFYFRLTQEAENLLLEEQKLKHEMEPVLVSKIRKLLMMSIDKTLLLYKIVHMRKDLGLPEGFQTNMLQKYPEFFKIVETYGGTAVELTSWDPDLAVSAWQRNIKSKGLNDNGSRRYPKVKLPKGYYLKRREKEFIRRFEDMSYFSPYSDFAHIDPTSREAERHACAVVHEVLSLTIEKRTLVDHLTHFRKDYKFSQKLHGMLERHPQVFYVSLKGNRDSVFLREAYNGSELIEKDPLVVVKEKLAKLMAENPASNSDDEGSGDQSLLDMDMDSIEDNVDGSWSDSNDGSDDEDNDLEFSVKPERELRRPLHIIQREQAMATSTRERW